MRILQLERQAEPGEKEGEPVDGQCHSHSQDPGVSIVDARLRSAADAER